MNTEDYYNQEEQPNKAVKIINLTRNIFMSIMFIGMGIVMLFATKFKMEVLYDFPETLRYLFGGICFLYGGFRVWRVFNNND